MLDDMGAEFVSVVVVSADMLRRGLTLGQALSERQDQRTGRDWAPAAGEGVPRLMLLSGMSHDELMSVIQDFQELGGWLELPEGALSHTWSGSAACVSPAVQRESTDPPPPPRRPGEGDVRRGGAEEHQHPCAALGRASFPPLPL